MTRLRTYADVMALTDRSPAEELLLEQCKAGEVTNLGTEALYSPTKAHSVRAELLRYLILGGCKDYRPDEHGVALWGGHVTGTLDLSFCTARGETNLRWCRFDQPIDAAEAHLAVLSLKGSHLPGLFAQGAQVTGGVFLDEGFTAKGHVNLSGAQIGGQLSCTGGRFEDPAGHALNAHSARVTGGVFLGRGFAATGEVSLSQAEIGVGLFCDGGRFENARRFALNAQNVRVTGGVFLGRGFAATGEVSLSGAEIGGQLSCIGGRFENAGGCALNAQRMRVTAGFYWRNVTIVAGAVYFASAHVGDLVDDLAHWPQRGPDGQGKLHLDGFVYDRISASATDAKSRLDWLSRGDRWNGVFHPQPYEQLAKVLGEMGHAEDRRVVLMARERLQWAAFREAVPGYVLLGWPFRWLIGFWAWLAEWGIGYGYKPWRSLSWALGLIGIGWLVAHMAWVTGDFAPNSDVIVNSVEWQVLARDQGVGNPAEVWSSAPGPGVVQGQGMDYEAFHSLAYAVDVVVPLVVLGQEATWAPSKDRGDWGFRLWWLRWVLTGAGWVVAAFGAAAVTGLIRRD